MTPPRAGSPAGAADGGEARPRAFCIRCERRRPMRLSLWCAECETAVNGAAELPLFQGEP